jgi:tRNA A-37 threonylcarbamoyl transferase component Bud32
MVKCRYCGTSNRAGSSYCSHCGGAFAVPAGQPPSSTHPAAAAAGVASAGAPPNAAGGARVTAAPPHPTTATGRLPQQAKLHGRYVILQTVGQGGMAAVYRALDTRTNRHVAIKEMSQDGLSPAEEAEALDAFRAEADILQRLRHPNLPRVWERFSEGARHYLVMEFVEGETLEQRQQAAGRALPEAEVLRWAAQLCSVLTYLHAQRPPIIFRDLKPANVMLTPRGEIKLIDFGIARVFHPGRLHDTQVLGTPGFAPPEQYGKTQTDPRADLYALGVTLYQLLTGYDPGSTPFSLPPAHTRNSALAPHVQAAIERATKLDREARYPTVADFERDLLRPDGFVFRGGQRARTLPELVALCRALPQEAQEHLYTHRFEHWLTAIGQPQMARMAASISATGGDRAAGLATFMAQASRPLPPPIPPTAAGRVARQAASRIAAQTARRLFASAVAAAANAVGTQVFVEVRPRSVNFGALIAGQRGSTAIAVGGQNGLPVTGRITPLAPWLRVDRRDFVGPSTIVQLSVDTAQLTRSGIHQTTLQITSGAQQLYVPISVEVLSTRGPNAAPPRKGSQGPQRATGKYTPARATPSWIRTILSWLTALGTASWAMTQAIQPLATHAPAPLAGLPLAAALLLVAAVAAAPAAVVGRWGADPLSRVFTALLGAGLGAGSTLALAQNWPALVTATLPTVVDTHLPAPLLALGLVLLSVGAALGAAPGHSRRMLILTAFVTRHARILLAVGALVVGGWVGFTLTHPWMYGLVAPCGAIAGMLVAVALFARANRLLQRAAGRP